MSDRQLKLQIVFQAVDKAVSKITGIKNSAVDVGKELTKARDALKKLNETQNNVTSFIKLKKQMGDNNAKMTEAQAKVKRLADEIRQVDKPTREMERAFARAKREASELGVKVDSDAESLQRMRDRLKDAGIHTRKLADAQKDLKGKIADATARVDEQKAAFANSKPAQPAGTGSGGGKPGPGSFTDGAVKAGLILGTIKEVSDIVAAPVISDAQAQEQLTQIGIKANLSREKLAAMRDEIARLGPQVRMVPEKLRGGVDFLAASGVKPEQALKMMEPLGKAAHANLADINDLAKGANAALTNLKVPLGKDDIERTRQTARMLDMMSVAGKEGNFEFNDMARSFPTLTARLAALGQEGPEAAGKLAAALQVAWIATGNSDEAANNLDNLMMKINAKETIKNFEKFGIDLPRAMNKAYAEGKGPLEAIAELTQKATGGDMGKLSYLFGDAQAQTGVQSLIQNMKEYQRIRDKVLGPGSAGEVERDFATRSQDVSSRWEKLQARWAAFKEGAGQLVQGLTNGLLTGVDNKLATGHWGISADAIAAAQKRSVTMGNQMGDGLALGMEQKTGRVKAAANNLAAAAQVQVRKDLQIRSPSRVFMALGGHISEGLAVGINRSAYSPIRAVGRMAGAVAGAGALSLSPASARAPAAAGAVAPVSVTNHFHITQAPGEDANALAERVAELVEHAHRSQKLRSLGDD